MTAPLPTGLRAEWRDFGETHWTASLVDALIELIVSEVVPHRWLASAYRQGGEFFRASHETRDEALFAAERAARRERRLRRDAELRAEGKTWTYALRWHSDDDADGYWFRGENVLWAGERHQADRFARYSEALACLARVGTGRSMVRIVRLISRPKKVAP